MPAPKLALLALFSSLTGCLSLSAGPSLSHDLSGLGGTTLGPRLGARGNFWSDGFQVGVENELPVALDHDNRAGYRFRGLLGYSDPPKPYQSPVGYELSARGGFGYLPWMRSNPIPEAGAQFGLPVRISPRRNLWDGESFAGAYVLLVPDIDLSLHVADIPRASVGGGLSIRIQSWSPEFP